MGDTNQATSLQSLDLETAWKRVKWDIGNRVFVVPAFVDGLLDLGLEEWLQEIRSEIERGQYSPRPCETCEVPKRGFHIRPGARLDLKDHLVFCALLQEMYPRIRDYIRMGKVQKDFAYLLRGSDAVPWFQPHAFGGWKAFQKVSVERIEGAQSVFFADISGFYENIDLGRLRYILGTIDIPVPLLELLFVCLRAWAEPRGRGIPQGLSPSDLLAKAYLEPIDRLLERDGFDHIRYVDDFRIFCRNAIEAKMALRTLTRLLRQNGLNIEAGKTDILGAHDARSKIDGRIPDIEKLRDGLLREMRAHGFEDPYIKVTSLGELEPEQDEVARGVLEAAFREHFLESDESSFDTSLFHYLLARLGRIQSAVALEFSIRQLSVRPEETSYVLEYLENLANKEEAASRAVAYACSEDAIYDYQLYLILKWLLDKRIPAEGSLELARHIMADLSKPLWLRSYALGFVGEFGDAADLDSIEASYASAANDLERAIVLCSIRRMAHQRRNSVYGRYGGDGFLNRLAVRWGRQSR